MKVYRVYWYWWWDPNSSGLANHVSDSYNKSVKTSAAYMDGDGWDTFQLSLLGKEWGTHLIPVKDKEDRHSMGVMSYFDWPYNENRRSIDSGESVTTLSLKTDEDNYTPSGKMVVTFPSMKGSHAVISIENGVRVLFLTGHTCEDKRTTVRLDVARDMQSDAYIYITLLQPHGITKNDLLTRLYGVVPSTVTLPESHLTPVIQSPVELKLDASYTISIPKENGKEMVYMLAIVDEDLLDLTRFHTSESWRVFNTWKTLGVNTWDLCNYMVGVYGDRIEQLLSIGGGDALDKGPKAIMNRFKPVVQFNGPSSLKKGKTARCIYQVPNYNGCAKAMVVTGNREVYGHADESVMVRELVMLLGTLSRIIGVGEKMVVPATVSATEDGVGVMNISIACSSNMEMVGEATRSPDPERERDQ